MNEQELGREIAKLLDFSANEHMKQSTVYRLQSARRAALEHCQPTLEIINSGNGTSVYGGHDPHFHTGKLLLLLIMLFAFALVSATYWQFLEKGKSAIDSTVLIDDLSSEAVIDNERETTEDLSIDNYIDNVLKMVDDISTDARIDHESDRGDDIPVDVRANDESELDDDISSDSRIDIDHGAELTNESSANVPVDNEIDEWLGSTR